MSSVNPTQWAQAFTKINNSDPELTAHGKFFTCSYMLDMEKQKVIVRMHAGKVDEIVVDPAPLDHYQFALRAPADTWRHMGVPMPEPMYHGIWAASFQKGMTMEGDILILMQNLRCFTRQIEILRQSGVPV